MVNAKEKKLINDIKILKRMITRARDKATKIHDRADIDGQVWLDIDLIHLTLHELTSNPLFDFFAPEAI